MTPLTLTALIIRFFTLICVGLALYELFCLYQAVEAFRNFGTTPAALNAMNIDNPMHSRPNDYLTNVYLGYLGGVALLLITAALLWKFSIPLARLFTKGLE